jgi:hypothetical protein
LRLRAAVLILILAFAVLLVVGVRGGDIAGVFTGGSFL